MANEKILSAKKAQAAEYADMFKNAKSVVFVDYKGINVADDTALRAELREENVKYTVVKNTILSFAAKEAGFDEALPFFEGSTAVAISDDEIAPARVLNKYVSKSKDKFNFKAGYVAGQFMKADEIASIANLPSRDGMVSILAGTLNGMIASLARAVNEVAKKSA